MPKADTSSGIHKYVWKMCGAFYRPDGNFDPLVKKKQKVSKIKLIRSESVKTFGCQDIKKLMLSEGEVRTDINQKGQFSTPSANPKCLTSWG